MGPAGALGVRFGLAAIKNVGEGAVESLLKPRRDEGPFASVEDLCRRADLSGVNKRTLECLIKVGALDGLGPRGALLSGIDKVVATAQREQKAKLSGQTTMFDLWGESVPVPVQSLELQGGDVSRKEKLAWERELLGVCVSEHPFSAVAARAAKETTVLCGHINEELVGQPVTVAGMVASVRPLLTKDGRQFISASLEDLEGSVELTVWPEVYDRTKDLWTDGELILVHGKVNDRRGVIQISCDGAQRYEVDPGSTDPGSIGILPAEAFEEPPLPPITRSAGASPAGEGQGNGRHANGKGHPNGNANPKRRSLAIELRESSDPDRDLITFETLLDLLQRYQGPDEVRLTVLSGGTAVPLELPQLGIRLGPDLLSAVAALVGDSAVIEES